MNNVFYWEQWIEDTGLDGNIEEERDCEDVV
jgi:hypothetical protein